MMFRKENDHFCGKILINQEAYLMRHLLSTPLRKEFEIRKGKLIYNKNLLSN